MRTGLEIGLELAVPVRLRLRLRLGLGLGLGLRPVGDLLALGGRLERDEEVVLVRRGVRGDLLLDVTAQDEVDQGLLERLHVEERALGHRLGDLLRAVFADQLGDAGVRDHDLERTDALRPRRAGASAG